MDSSQVALILGLIILLTAVMYLASKVQRLHSETRHLRHLVRKLEGKEDIEEGVNDKSNDAIGE